MKLNQVTQIVDMDRNRLSVFVSDVKVDGINTQRFCSLLLLELTFVSQDHKLKD